jgi:hypothetical protein
MTSSAVLPGPENTTDNPKNKSTTIYSLKLEVDNKWETCRKNPFQDAFVSSACDILSSDNPIT